MRTLSNKWDRFCSAAAVIMSFVANLSGLEHDATLLMMFAIAAAIWSIDHTDR